MKSTVVILRQRNDTAGLGRRYVSDTLKLIRSVKNVIRMASLLRSSTCIIKSRFLKAARMTLTTSSPYAGHVTHVYMVSAGTGGAGRGSTSIWATPRGGSDLYGVDPVGTGRGQTCKNRNSNRVLTPGGLRS